jgi:hypothetical protein
MSIKANKFSAYPVQDALNLGFNTVKGDPDVLAEIGGIPTSRAEGAEDFKSGQRVGKLMRAIEKRATAASAQLRPVVPENPYEGVKTVETPGRNTGVNHPWNEPSSFAERQAVTDAMTPEERAARDTTYEGAAARAMQIAAERQAELAQEAEQGQ